MRIPLKYNLRSLWVRRVSTLMTALGIGLTVAVLVIMMALVRGLDATFVDTGYESDLIVIRKGSQNETNSYFNRDLFQTVKLLPEIARDEDDQPWAVGELIVVINSERREGDSSNIVIRGTSDRGFQMRPEVQIVEGRRHRKGVRELIVSQSLSRRFKDMALGDKLRISDNEWAVVGLFDASGTAYDSEIWGDYDEISLAWIVPSTSPYWSGPLRLRASPRSRSGSKRTVVSSFKPSPRRSTTGARRSPRLGSKRSAHSSASSWGSAPVLRL